MSLTNIMLRNLRYMLENANSSIEQKLLEMLNNLATAPASVKEEWVNVCEERHDRGGVLKNWSGSEAVLEAFVRSAPQTAVRQLINRHANLPVNLVVKVLGMPHKKTYKTRLEALETAARSPRNSEKFAILKTYAMHGLTAKQTGTIRSVLAQYGYLLNEDEIIELATQYAQSQGVVPIPWSTARAPFLGAWVVDMEKVLRCLVQVEKKYCEPVPNLSDEEKISGLFTLTPTQRLYALESASMIKLDALVEYAADQEYGGIPVSSYVPEFSLNPSLGDFVKYLGIEKVRRLQAVCPTSTVTRCIVENLFLKKGKIDFEDFSIWIRGDIVAPVDSSGALLRSDLKFLAENIPLADFMELTGNSDWASGMCVNGEAEACIAGYLEELSEEKSDETFWALLQDVDSMARTSPITDIVETIKAASK